MASGKDSFGFDFGLPTESKDGAGVKVELPSAGERYRFQRLLVMDDAAALTARCLHFE